MEDKILAIVEEREIKESQLEQTILRFPKEKQSYLKTEEGKKELLEQLISMELIYSYSLDNDVKSSDIFKKQIEHAEKEILNNIVLSDLMSKVDVTEEEIKGYYEVNIDAFKGEEEREASHILVDTIEKAETIIDEIKKGMTFEEAASKYSSCPSKERGGNLGSFTRGKMVPEFEKAAFALPVETLSEPIKTTFGYHIIKVNNIKEAGVREYSQVKDQIREGIYRERQNFKYNQFNDGLKKIYKVKVMDI
ncbi:MAG TPA: peptidylprolyl isomerase [Clostridiaceae bacterium]